MCGIVGCVGPEAHAFVRDALPTLAHRGPDSQGTVTLKGAAIGMTRLAVQDPSQRADQPMSGGNLHVVFNGEIYNFRELRDVLVDLGHEFVTSGDTEVVLKALLEWGSEALAKFDGMFAIAWWDSTTGELKLARDRFGIKPLYWKVDPHAGFAFASEARVLKKNSAIDRRAIAEYLYLGSPVTTVAYVGINEMRPGHIMTVATSGLEIEPWLEVSPFSPVHRYAKSVDVAIADAVESHLVSDRPVALFLSGGFDSALLASSLPSSRADVVAITLDTGHNQADVVGAMRTAQQYGIRHEVVKISIHELADLVADFVKCQDQPTLDGFNTYLICRAAAERGRVVALSGLGGDEALGGYGYYQRSVLRSAIGWIPKPVMAGVAPRLEKMTGHSAQRLLAFANVREPIDKFFAARELFTTSEVCQLTGVELDSRLGFQVNPDFPPSLQLRDLDYAIYLRSTLLRDSDIFSMCHGVELRVPLLDPCFVSAATGFSKIGLANQLGDPYLASLARERKRGFVLPWAVWLAELAGIHWDEIPFICGVDESGDCGWVANFLTLAMDSAGDDPQRRWAVEALALWFVDNIGSEGEGSGCGNHDCRRDGARRVAAESAARN